MTITTLLLSKLGTSWGYAAIATVLAFFAPISILFYLICFLVGADLITAIIKSLQNCEDYKGLEKIKCIKSRKLRRSVLKLFIYQLVIACVYFFSMAIFQGDIYLANFAAGSIALVELSSICENMSIITHNNVFTKIFKNISKMFSDKISDKIENPK